MNWETAITKYQNFLQIERGLSKNTITNYIRDIQKLQNYVRTLKNSPSPISINSTTIQDCVYEISKTVSARSQARLISSLRSFFDYLVFDNYREDTPTALLENPSISKKLPTTLHKTEIDAIIASIDLTHPQGERNKTIIETLYSCGLRVSELINLTISDLFFNDGYIRILGKGNKYRFVPIHKTTITLLEYYIKNIRSLIAPKKNEEDIIFLNRRGKRLTRQMVFLILKQHALKAGVQKNIGPHTLRHSFATYLLSKGADLTIIQQLLGHESITTTEIYLHLDTSNLIAEVKKYHPRANNS